MATQIQTAAIDIPRDAHYQLNPVTGLYERTLLVEGPATNNIASSADWSAAAWTKTTCTVGTGITDPAGGTAACTLTATAANGQAIQVLAAGASLVRTNAVWIRRRTGAGAVQLLTPDNAVFSTVTLTSAWQRLSPPAVAASTARAIGVRLVTSGDAVDVWNAEQEDGPFVTSDIVTAGAAVTRSADIVSFPFPYAPLEMTVYLKYWERGTMQSVGTRVFHLGAAAGTAPHLLLGNVGGALQALHNNNTTSVTANAPVTPAMGDMVEVRVTLSGNGTVVIGIALNGGAESTLGSVASALANAWSANTLWLGQMNGSAAGFAAFSAVKVLRGIQTLAAMRAA